MGALQSANNSFFGSVYRNGLYTLIDRYGPGAMGGTFGACRLSTFMSGGRLMITISQGKCSFTIIGLDDDRRGNSFSENSREGTDKEIAAMLRNFLSNWPSDPQRQAEMFRGSSGFLGMVT